MKTIFAAAIIAIAATGANADAFKMTDCVVNKFIASNGATREQVEKNPTARAAMGQMQVVVLQLSIQMHDMMAKGVPASSLRGMTTAIVDDPALAAAVNTCILD